MEVRLIHKKLNDFMLYQLNIKSEFWTHLNIDDLYRAELTLALEVARIPNHIFI